MKGTHILRCPLKRCEIGGRNGSPVFLNLMGDSTLLYGSCPHILLGHRISPNLPTRGTQRTCLLTFTRHCLLTLGVLRKGVLVSDQGKGFLEGEGNGTTLGAWSQGMMALHQGDLLPTAKGTMENVTMGGSCIMLLCHIMRL